MNPERIAELRKLCNEAKPQPWEYGGALQASLDEALDKIERLKQEANANFANWSRAEIDLEMALRRLEALGETVSHSYESPGVLEDRDRLRAVLKEMIEICKECTCVEEEPCKWKMEELARAAFDGGEK